MLQACPSQPLKGTLKVPGDKSISHRAALLGAIAQGTSTFTHFLTSEDCLDAIKAIQQLGIKARLERTTLLIEGKGPRGLSDCDAPIDCGNAGTLARLLTGLCSGAGIACTLIGDNSLSKRPFERVTKPLSLMGARFQQKTKDPLPLSIEPDKPLCGMHHEIKVASAQVKSTLMIAATMADSPSVFVQKVQTRDHTERMLKAMGARIQINEQGIHVAPSSLKPITMSIPGDFSSAAFFIVAALLIEGSDLQILNVGLNPTRIGLLHVLKDMGADIEYWIEQDDGEPIGTIHVRSSILKGITIPEQWISNAIDEMPVLFIACAFAKGRSHLKGAGELRVKESDRLSVMAKGLTQCGVQVWLEGDELSIQGGGFEGGRVKTFGDHRICMAFLVAGWVGNPVSIDDSSSIATSFPSFLSLAQQLGLRTRKEEL